MQQFLVIQTAFIGDVVLATGLIEKLHAAYPDAQIDFLVRQGNEGLLKAHPYLRDVLVWEKKQGKLKNLFHILRRIRRTRYDKVINVQRFAATGILTAFSGAKESIGFDKNPLSRFFTRRIPHIVSDPKGPALHEYQRNDTLISDFAPGPPAKPRLYPTEADYQKVAAYKSQSYITVSPASVWFTKQYPAEKWIDFISQVPTKVKVFLLGAPSDKELCERIANGVRLAATVLGEGTTAPLRYPEIEILAGQLNFLQSAALMRDAAMNYVNDSAPMHFASSVNAPVSAVYCSTIPAFGFGPLSDRSHIIEVQEPLECRPCGLHGYKACPLTHFNCARHIQDSQLLQTLLISPEL